MAKLGNQKQPMSVTGINPDLNWKLNNYTTMNFTRCKSAASFCAPFLIGVFVITGQHSTIFNWRWKGNRFDVSIGNGVTTLHRDGKLVIQIAGGTCVVRHFNTSNGGCSFTLKSRDKLQVELATTGAPQGIGRVEVPAGRHQVFANMTGIIQVTNIE